MQPGLMVQSVLWVLLAHVIKYIRIIISMFILIFLQACTADPTQKINSKKNTDEKSKANVTFSGSINNGICSNCN